MIRALMTLWVKSVLNGNAGVRWRLPQWLKPKAARTRFDVAFGMAEAMPCYVWIVVVFNMPQRLKPKEF